MSKAREVLTQVIADKIAQALLFGNTDGKATILAKAVVEALVTESEEHSLYGWLITQGEVYRVQETNLADPNEESWTFDAHCEPPQDGSEDGE